MKKLFAVVTLFGLLLVNARAAVIPVSWSGTNAVIAPSGLGGNCATLVGAPSGSAMYGEITLSFTIKNNGSSDVTFTRGKFSLCEQPGSYESTAYDYEIYLAGLAAGESVTVTRTYSTGHQPLGWGPAAISIQLLTPSGFTGPLTFSNLTLSKP